MILYINHDNIYSVGKVPTRRVSGYLQIDTGPRRSPSARPEKLLEIYPAEPRALDQAHGPVP